MTEPTSPAAEPNRASVESPADRVRRTRRLRWFLIAAILCVAGLMLLLQGLSHAGGFYWYAHYPRGVTEDRPQGFPTPEAYALTLANFAQAGATIALASLLLFGQMLAWRKMQSFAPDQGKRADCFAGETPMFHAPDAERVNDANALAWKSPDFADRLTEAHEREAQRAAAEKSADDALKINSASERR